MGFVHSTVWRISFHLFVYYYMFVVFYKLPISVAYVNVSGETYAEVAAYTGCPRRNVKYFGRVFLMLNYTDITQNTYIQS